MTGGTGVDFALDFVGTRTTAQTALAATRRGGTLVLTGLGTTEFGFGVNELIRSGRTVKGNTMGMGAFRSEYPKLVDLYRKGTLKLDELVSQTLRLDQVQVAFDAIEHGDVARSVLVTT